MYFLWQLYPNLTNIISTCLIPALWIWFYFSVWPWRYHPLLSWKEFVDGHVLVQAEFNVFDGCVFEDEQLTLVTIV